MTATIHHVELWTDDLALVGDSWAWLFEALAWTEEPSWPNGRTWRASDGSYVVLEQSPAVSGPHDRMRSGMNHLAISCVDLDRLLQLRAGAGEHGWREMFADRIPHAGGPDHTALYIENAQGFEVEVVAPHSTT